MSFSEILRMTFQNMRANLLRSILTIFIIAIGIWALIGIITSLDAVAYSLNDNLSGLGANSFTIERKGGQVGSNRRGRRQKSGEAIKIEQAQEFKDRFEVRGKVSISFWASSLATVKFEETETNPNIGFVGVDENYFDVKGMSLEHGRGFSKMEVDDGQAKAILGLDVAKKLFNNKPEQALDKIVLVGNIRYRVIGVLATKGSSMGNQDDRAVYAPLLNVKAYYGSSQTNYNLIVAVNDAAEMESAKSEATGLFRQIRHLRPGDDDDFELFASDSIVAILKENTRSLQLAAFGIGLITLFSAAIGLMNIMLVSVTERTREIGIYKSLGATRMSILTLFLSEALVICQIGGISGIIIGVLTGNLLSLILGGSFVVPWFWVILGFFLCLTVGVVSGFYPALKASRLDPIEALRYE